MKIQDPQPLPAKRLVLALGWVVAIPFLALVVTGFVLINLPKLSADVSGSLRSNDPIGTIFNVSNEGSLPVYDVKAECEVMRLDMHPPGNRNFVGPATFEFPESRVAILPPQQKMTVPCGRAIASKLDNLEAREINAEMFIVVTYRPKGLWWYKSEKFPMGTQKVENGTWTWKSIPR